MEVSGSVMSQPLYPLGNSTQQPLDQRLGELQSWSGHDGEETKSHHSSYWN